jgi:hypothetical protein
MAAVIVPDRAARRASASSARPRPGSGAIPAPRCRTDGRSLAAIGAALR